MADPLTLTPLGEPRDVVDYDVVIVGGGPAGLAAGIRLRQLAAETGREVSVCLLEKAGAIGAHTLSGAIVDPRALAELFPDWRERGAPLRQPVTSDEFLFLSEKRAVSTPHLILPDCFRNDGNFIASLEELTQWLGERAAEAGVEIFTGFPAQDVLHDPATGAVRGIVTADMGIGRDGAPTGNVTPGIELHARYTLFAEGSRGHLGRRLIERFALDADSEPQSYAIGIKEIWQVAPQQHRPGHVVHTSGWPLDARTYGGGFLYHLDGGKVLVGLVVGLDYANPYLDPFEELQRLKTHPAIRATLEGGTRIGYGARSITAGGLLALPRPIFPGGALIGCEAGFLNAPRIKGSHAAIKTGMLAAEAAFGALGEGRGQDELAAYPEAFETSWLHAELSAARNFKAWFKNGLAVGTLMAGIEQLVLPRLGVISPPWTRKAKLPDHAALEPAAKHRPIAYPKPDGRLTFDKASSLFLSGTNHNENQPPHLTLKREDVPVEVNLKVYAGPEARYCPAGVYAFVEREDGPHLTITAQNCLHCKTCDIKDPTQNIVWVAPEGGDGPNYVGM